MAEAFGKDDAQADPTTLSRKADTAGRDERRVRPVCAVSERFSELLGCPISPRLALVLN